MEFKDILKKAKEIKVKYAIQNKKLGRKKWLTQDYYQGFVGDVGDLGKLIMAKNNLRHYKQQDKKNLRMNYQIVFGLYLYSPMN